MAALSVAFEPDVTAGDRYPKGPMKRVGILARKALAELDDFAFRVGALHCINHRMPHDSVLEVR